MKNCLVKIMRFNENGKPAIPEKTSAPDSEMIGFVTRFLEHNGAVIEKNPAGVQALLPEELQVLLQTPEYIHISGGPARAHSEAQPFEIGYGAPLLDRMVRAALSTIPLLYSRLEFDYIKSGGFSRLLDDQLRFYGAVASIETIADVIIDYVYVACRYKAQSDEQKEGLLEMVFNTDTRLFVPDMAEKINHAGCRIFFDAPPDHGASKMLDIVAADIGKQSQLLLFAQLGSFQESMNRRFKRDVKNMEAYYVSLKAEMAASLENTALSDAARTDRQEKIDAIPAELARKTDDLFKKYSVRVRLNPIAAKIINAPAKKIICKLTIGKNTRRLFLTYNPVIRELEPPACAGCGKNITHIHFHADLKPVCLECSKGH